MEMNTVLAKRMLALQEAAKADEEYWELLAEYRILDGQLVNALEEMSADHRDAVMDYLGAVHAINRRMVELALTLNEKC
jgi:hypothetical protein